MNLWALPLGFSVRFQLNFNRFDIDAHQGHETSRRSVFFARKYPPAHWKWYAVHFFVIPAVMGRFGKISKNQGGIIMALEQALGIKVKRLLRRMR